MQKRRKILSIIIVGFCVCNRQNLIRKRLIWCMEKSLPHYNNPARSRTSRPRPTSTTIRYVHPRPRPYLVPWFIHIIYCATFFFMEKSPRHTYVRVCDGRVRHGIKNPYSFSSCPELTEKLL